jgi:hypothetical protein
LEGVYQYGTGGGFPNQVYTNSNYWADVVFTTDAGTAPTVSGVSPASGSTSGSIDVTISGRNFTGVTSVRFGTIDATSFTVNSATSITATAPAEAAGTVDITVTSAAGTSASNAADRYTFVAASSYNLFGNATPLATEVYDTSPAELGVQFQSSVAGTVMAIRVYLGAATQSGSKVDLWSASGTLLSSGTIPVGSGATPGWVTVSLAQPVSIQAGVTYTASYYSSSGNFAYTPNYFTSPFTSGPLTGLAGVYQYGTGDGFPAQVNANSNYWVDVVFIPS